MEHFYVYWSICITLRGKNQHLVKKRCARKEKPHLNVFCLLKQLIIKSNGKNSKESLLSIISGLKWQDNVALPRNLLPGSHDMSNCVHVVDVRIAWLFPGLRNYSFLRDHFQVDMVNLVSELRLSGKERWPSERGCPVISAWLVLVIEFKRAGESYTISQWSHVHNKNHETPPLAKSLN